MAVANWHRLGFVDELKTKPLAQVLIGDLPIALSYRDGEFGAISGRCLHVGGSWGKGQLADDGFVVCPWHSWQFHRLTGEARPGIPAAVSRYELKVENGELFVNLTPATPTQHAPHPIHPLTREVRREPGPLRVVGISTTAMNRTFPRYSTSEDLLRLALDRAKEQGAESKLIRLNDLAFKNCEGYYSKSAQACTWPCTITQMDPQDELTDVYESLVFWADVVLVATSIRWGSPSSLYAKMVERMNCIQNEITTHDRVLIQNKVAGFIITGGQDNIPGRLRRSDDDVFRRVGLCLSTIPVRGTQPRLVGRGYGEQHRTGEGEPRAARGDGKPLAVRCLKMADTLLTAGRGKCIGGALGRSQGMSRDVTTGYLPIRFRLKL